MKSGPHAAPEASASAPAKATRSTGTGYVTLKKAPISGNAIFANSAITSAMVMPVFSTTRSTSLALSPVNHKAIHGFTDLGLFNPMEWAILSNPAKKRWIAHYNVNELYAAKIDEGIAFAFGDPKRAQEPAGIRRIFVSVRNALSAIANAFRGLGFNTPEKIFRNIERGMIGARPRPGDAKGNLKFQAARKPPAPPGGRGPYPALRAAQQRPTAR